MGPADDFSFLQTLEDRDTFDVLFLSFNAHNIIQHITPFYNNLQWIQNLGTGVEHILKCEQVRTDDSIVLTNMKSISQILLSEFAVFGLLYFYKQIPLFQSRFLAKHPLKDQVVRALESSKVMVVGIGGIGEGIAKKFKFGFNMEVTGVKRDLKNVEHLRAFTDEVIDLASIPLRVHEFDVVVCALPFIAGGPIFTEDVIAKMKKGSVFINVGRGSVVDESALIKYLLNDHLLGAAMDVIQDEPIKPESHFYDERLKDKLFYSFHNMDNSKEFYNRLEHFIEENIQNYLEGRDLVRQVNKEFGY